MGDKTKIEWTDATINPIRARRKDTGKIGWHCVKVSPECAHCYAETTNKRNMPGCGTGLPYTVASTDLINIELIEDVLHQAIRWKRSRRIFVCSMTDIFGEFVPDWMIVYVFAVMACAKQHTFQVLTKRPERMHSLLSSIAFWKEVEGNMYAVIEMIVDPLNRRSNDIRATAPEVGPAEPLPNVWLGVTTGDQEQANKRIPWLLRTPAEKRFISYEPALGPLRLWKLTSLDYYNNSIGYETYPLIGMQAIPDSDWPHPKLDWVIAGAESGVSARPAHPDWFRSVRDQCVEADVPFFFKQWGEWALWTPENNAHIKGTVVYPDIQTGKDGPANGNPMVRVGKHKAGALLDGQEWKQFPTMS